MKLFDNVCEFCEGLIIEEELFKVVNLMENNKLLGFDGLIINFYKYFWFFLGEKFICVYNYVFWMGSLVLF